MTQQTLDSKTRLVLVTTPYTLYPFGAMVPTRTTQMTSLGTRLVLVPYPYTLYPFGAMAPLTMTKWDALTRVRLASFLTASLTTRFLLRAMTTLSLGTRLRVQSLSGQSLVQRVRLAALTMATLTSRLLLQSRSTSSLATRSLLRSLSLRDVATRLNTAVQQRRTLPHRVRLAALSSVMGVGIRLLLQTVTSSTSIQFLASRLLLLDAPSARRITLAQIDLLPSHSATNIRRPAGMGSVLPSYERRSGTRYLVNGTPLDQAPLLASSPRPVIQTAATMLFQAGTRWTLTFAHPSSLVQSLFPLGTSSSLFSSPMAGGEQVTCPVQTITLLSPDTSLLLVEMVITQTLTVSF